MDMSGQNLMNLIFSIWFVIAMLSPMLLSKELVTNFALFFGLFAAIFLSSILVVFLNMKPDILGRWSREGRIKHEKVLRYKKFMEDLTLMKEKGIKDVILWERLLVHATALGVADKVINAMDAIMPNYKSNPRLRMSAAVAISLPSVTRNTVHPYTRGRSRGGFGAGGRGGGGGDGAI
ncbi:MAG: DUF2207 domain-containing protein [Candidatus Micrarchaeia archaeon]